jgi:hypothetical protein
MYVKRELTIQSRSVQVTNLNLFVKTNNRFIKLVRSHSANNFIKNNFKYYKVQFTFINTVNLLISNLITEENYMSILNCWEVKKCGREPNGIKSKELGVCPAVTTEEKNGVNNGINAGRICWRVAGTLCGGAVQGTFTQKAMNCSKCDIFLT